MGKRERENMLHVHVHVTSSLRRDSIYLQHKQVIKFVSNFYLCSTHLWTHQRRLTPTLTILLLIILLSCSLTLGYSPPQQLAMSSLSYTNDHLSWVCYIILYCMCVIDSLFLLQLRQSILCLLLIGVHRNLCIKALCEALFILAVLFLVIDGSTLLYMNIVCRYNNNYQERVCNTDTNLDFTLTLWLQHTLYHVILADHECSEFVEPYLNTCSRYLVTSHA